MKFEMIPEVVDNESTGHGIGLTSRIVIRAREQDKLYEKALEDLLSGVSPQEVVIYLRVGYKKVSDLYDKSKDYHNLRKLK